MSTIKNVKTIFNNNAVDTIYLAAASCYNNYKNSYSYSDKCDYIGKRVKAGHTSILEHGFLTIILGDVNQDIIDKYFLEFTNCTEFLKVFTSEIEDNAEEDEDMKPRSIKNILVSGSIRGYNELLTQMESYPDNVILTTILEELYTHVDKCMFVNLEQEGKQYIDFNRFLPQDTQEAIGTNARPINVFYNPMNIFFNKNHFKGYIDGLIELGFTYHDIIKCIPITVQFLEMSRTATHQLVRHRNAITQESQRFVKFTGDNKDPNPEKYMNKEFEIELFDKKEKMTLEGLSQVFVSIYKQLLGQGMLKEEARAFLPQNVKSKVVMTFTLYNLFKFLELRTDSHAQYEIRKYAEAIRDNVCAFAKIKELYNMWDSIS